MSETPGRPGLPVNEPVRKATKAVVAAAVSAAGVIVLFGKSVADGHLSWDEAGEVIGAALFALGITGGVYGTRNGRKGS